MVAAGAPVLGQAAHCPSLLFVVVLAVGGSARWAARQGRLACRKIDMTAGESAVVSGRTGSNRAAVRLCKSSLRDRQHWDHSAADAYKARKVAGVPEDHTPRCCGWCMPWRDAPPASDHNIAQP